MFSSRQKDRIVQMLDDFKKAQDFLRYPSITDGFSDFKWWVEGIATRIARKEIKDLDLGCEVEREEFDLLLEHLGLEIEDGKRIVKKVKYTKKGTK